MQARRMKEGIAVERKSLDVPADPVLVDKLAARYRSAELGGLNVLRNGPATWFDFGDWKSEMASRRNDDGTVEFVTISPSEGGYKFIVTAAQGA
ncbi:MAG TPA: serine hydrolase, partial [Lysobacter sp.]